MARRRITQETFDAVVRENMEEFDMDAAEALKEAVEQFESQGNAETVVALMLPTITIHKSSPFSNSLNLQRW